MAVSPEDLAAGTLALQVFVKNAKNVEITVDVAFAVIPSVLGIGAAGLLGSGIINTAKEVRNNISLLRTLGPGLIYGGALMGKGLGKGLGKGRDWAAEKWPILTRIPGPNLIFKPPKKKGGKDQNTQGNQEGQGGIELDPNIIIRHIDNLMEQPKKGQKEEQK